MRALESALARSWPPDATEAIAAVLEAAGAMRLGSATATLEAYCHHENPTLQDHAARALTLLRGTRATCPPVASATRATELDALISTEVTLELITDHAALRLTLDPSLAPVAVTRFVELARAGFYDGITFHRVVPGFVVQFGDPAGDGFGGLGKDHRYVAKPRRYLSSRSMSGVALAGRDTGLEPALRHAGALSRTSTKNTLIVGKATGDLAAIAEGRHPSLGQDFALTALPRRPKRRRHILL